MTLTSPARNDVKEEDVEDSANLTKERRLEVLRVDLAQAFKECGPNWLTPHPTHGERFFVIADKDTVLDKQMCTKHGIVHRSQLTETVTEAELDELIRELSQEGYHIKKYEKGGNDITGWWIKFQTIYYAGDDK